MNLHVIQKAWIKQFVSQGSVLIIDRETLASELQNPNYAAFVKNLQSERNEAADQKIETQAISKLHKLKKGAVGLSDKEREYLNRWVALHMTRSYRNIQDLQQDGFSYDQGRGPCLEDSLKMVETFSDVWIKRYSYENEPLILSDHPVIDLAQDALVLPFEPRMIVAFSNRDPGGASFEGRSWCEAMNEISFQASESFVLCDPRHVPDFEALRARSRTRVLFEVKHRPIRIPRK